MEYLLIIYLSIGTLVYTVPSDKTCSELYQGLEAKNIIQYVNIYDDSGKITAKVTKHNDYYVHAWGCQVNTN